MSGNLPRRNFLASSGCAALGFSLSPLLSQKRATEKLCAELETLLPKLMADVRVPGLSIVLLKDARLFWRRAFGVRDNATKIPVDHNTVFEAASVSKTVFAYAVLKLCEKGILALDTPLTKYVSQPYLEGDARLALITARHVLSHTSGFQNWRSAQDPLKIQFTPGEKFSYSGEGYSYLQSVVTQLTGHVNPNDCATFEAEVKVCATDIDRYMKTNVLQPFRMQRSSYLPEPRLSKNTARPHDATGQPYAKKIPTTKAAAIAARYAAAGGLLTTPSDYAKFLLEVIHPKPSDAFRLTPTSLREMLRPQVKVDDTHSWALGWQIHHTAKGDLLQHGGENPGFQCFVSAAPENQSGFIVMTNGDNGWRLISHPDFDEGMRQFVFS